MRDRPAPRLAVTDTPPLRPSARVGTVAAMLDMDASHIRRLVRDGTLEAHQIGKRGVRIYLDSVRAYQQRRPIIPAAPHAAPPAAPPPTRHAGHREAIAALRALGVL